MHVMIGRVGGSPQLRGTEEHPVVVFPMATNIRYRKPGSNGDEYETKTDWHNIAIFKPYLRYIRGFRYSFES